MFPGLAEATELSRNRHCGARAFVVELRRQRRALSRGNANQPMNTITGGLRARLEGFEIDEPGATLPFTARLARENGWTFAFAGRVVREYKRFLFLTAAAGHPVTPPEEVDQAWHLHMVYTRSYWDRLCGEVLGRPLHHDPTQGGAAEGAKFHDWYARTLESYLYHFGEAPPPDIWPPVEKRFARAGEGQWVDRSRALVIPLPFARPRLKFRFRWLLMATLGSLALSIPSCTRSGISVLPLDWTGGPFLVLYAMLYVLTIVWALRIKTRRLSRFEPQEEPAPLSDPYETAFLSGGGRRVMQAAISRLVAAGALEVVKGKWGRAKLRATDSMPEPLYPVEQGVLANARHAQGVSMSSLLTCASHSLSVIEHRLAGLGLKPTAGERGKASFVIMVPFLLVAAFGLCKVFIGLDRDRPVGFLVLFLIATVITGIILAAKLKYLTAAGQRMLDTFRTNWRSQGSPRSSPDEIGTSVALLGLTALAGVEGMGLLQKELNRAQPDKADSGGGGCGTSGCGSSGCGSSGCGSSGCGGCGGGD